MTSRMLSGSVMMVLMSRMVTFWLAVILAPLRESMIFAGVDFLETRLMGHFGAFLLFPGFRFQPISRFLVLPGAWARFSPCRDRLASALPVLSDCRRRLLCSQQSCFGVTSFFLFCPLLSGGPGPSPSPVRRERGREVPYVRGAPSIFGRHTSCFRARASGPSHFQLLPEPPVLRPGPQPCPHPGPLPSNGRGKTELRRTLLPIRRPRPSGA